MERCLTDTALNATLGATLFAVTHYYAAVDISGFSSRLKKLMQDETARLGRASRRAGNSVGWRQPEEGRDECNAYRVFFLASYTTAMLKNSPRYSCTLSCR